MPRLPAWRMMDPPLPPHSSPGTDGEQAQIEPSLGRPESVGRDYVEKTCDYWQAFQAGHPPAREVSREGKVACGSTTTAVLPATTPVKQEQ